MSGHFRRWFIATASGEDEKQGKSELDFGSVTHSLRHLAIRGCRGLRSARQIRFTFPDSVLASIEARMGLRRSPGVGAIGYYWGSGISARHRGGGPAEIASADPEGLTDLWITGKYRFLKGKPGNLALIAGIKCRRPR